MGSLGTLSGARLSILSKGLAIDNNIPGATRWMLIVEDNPDDERLARRTIGMVGRPERIVCAPDGQAAIDALKSEELPILILLDLKLPRLSGVEVLIAIKDDPRLRRIPVVILTSSDEFTDRAACYELGCNAFVRKPIDYDEYRRAVGALVEFWLDVNIAA